ncbi:MAG TPA: restriction endonuclease subunit S [Desulfonatronum sp.]|nr:restriction endonuclease subunit S [Desulfonatronum sp.]
MSQLFGWEGALALSSEDFSDHFVSPQFPTFLCAPELNREYLGYFTRQPVFWHDLGSRTRGMEDRRRTLNPEALFACEIPLPDRKEQDRIVAKLDALSARIDEARELLMESQVEALSLITSLHHSLAEDRVVNISDLLCLEEDRIPVAAVGEYPQVGIKSFGGGFFAKEPVIGLNTTYKYFNRLSSGMVVLSQVKGWEGAVAVCPEDLEGRFASPEYRTFRCLNGAALPEYLSSLVKTEWFHGLLATATRGQGARRERTRPEMFLDIELPMPDIKKQARAVEVFRRLWDVTPLNETTITQLDAMLPSILDKAFKGEL